ncbi:hypothetical protein DFH07DRAFT_930768 [Mycena maculata]|uniref:Uncharacterized protein n=1 Tax=Mycena maculata TaxID=230809 RepID=A0AAD7MQJ8_9AGAR|nr:hypothetical protein DFH07DRAFT_930768 [Mycena maculata]
MASNNTFTLHVNIAPDQVSLLKTAGYVLCLSKKVNNDYCVVWTGSQFNAVNTFQWTESYQVFGANTFQNGALVQATSAAVDIAFGQTAILDDTGTMQPATGPISGASFSVTNEYQPINFGVNQSINGNFLPIYLDQSLTVIGDETFTPIISVLAFFSKQLQTSSMYSKATSSAIEVTYNGTTTKTVSYVDAATPPNGNGIWVSGTQSAGFGAVAPRSWVPGKGFVPLPLAADAFAVAALVNKFTEMQVESGGNGFGASQNGDSQGVDSTGTGNGEPVPGTCPMTAIMTFDNNNSNNQAHMLAALNKGHASGQWPSSLQGLKIGGPVVIDNKITVLLDTIPSGGAAHHVEAKWKAYAAKWTKDVTYA